jgi:hypothetical protein
VTKTRFIPYWTTSVFSSTVTDLVLIYGSVISSVSVARWLTLHIILRLNEWTQSEFYSYVTTDCQSASLSWNKAPIWGLRPNFYYCQTVAGLLMWGAASDESCCWPSPAQLLSGPSPVGLATIFYCVRFETSLFVASCHSQRYGGGIRPPPPHRRDEWTHERTLFYNSGWT